MRQFGLQSKRWNEHFSAAVLRLGCDSLGGSFKAGMRLFRRLFQGWDETMWVEFLRLG